MQGPVAGGACHVARVLVCKKGSPAQLEECAGTSWLHMVQADLTGGAWL